MTRSSCPRCHVATLVAVVIVAVTSIGCHMRQTIDAASLPSAYDIGSKAYKPVIDLSKLARRSINSELIYPGDVLDVIVNTGAEEKPREPQPYRVDPQGNVEFPMVGPVHVAGVTMAEAERLIQVTSIERRIYRRPIVTVLLNSRRIHHVRVVGAVQNPGDYEVPAAANDLLTAIVAAGGLNPEEAGTTIEIRHPVAPSEEALVLYEEESSLGPEAHSVHVDLIDAMQGNAGDLRLRDGSVVMVHELVPRTVYVTGLVAKAGEYELSQDQPLRVTQAIATAGGRKLELANTVHVTRYVPGREQPVVVKVSMRKAKADSRSDLALAPGDVVSVEETPVTFVVDTLRNFLRFGFSSALPGF